MGLFEEEYGSSAARPEALGNTDQRFAELRKRFAPVLSLLEQRGAAISHMHVENDQLLIRGTVRSEDDLTAVQEKARRLDESFSEILLDLVPDGGQPKARMHRLQPGDTLQALAERYYGDPAQYVTILSANQDKLPEPDALPVGDEILIPPDGRTN